MSDQHRTIEEYIERYARDYCKGNIEEAKEHAIVQEVIKEKEVKQMAKCKECKHLDLTQRTRSGYCVCTNTKRKTYQTWGGSKTMNDLKAPWAKACKTGFEPRNEILGGGE